jgi:uncharacterized membrane protein YfcA
MLGSVPSAFFGAYLISRIGGDDAGDRIKTILGAVLIVAAGAMVVKLVVQARRQNAPTGEKMPPEAVRPLPTLAIGVFGGLVVGMTSVGSGSLMIVLLMLLYPMLSAREMVGTDLVQAIPLVASAALGHLVFGHASFDTTTSVLLGAIPGVYFGAQVSSRASDKYIRPVLVAVLTISALKLLDVPNGVVLGVSIGALVLGIAYAVVKQVQRRDRADRDRELLTT